VSGRIILEVTGSIAAFKAAALASKLVGAGYQVQCILSTGGAHFIGEATLEGLTGRPVLGEIFEKTRALDHIRLVDWCDLILLYPASANQIGRLRAGLADDLIGALFLANNFLKPVWIAPAMNPGMFSHPAVRENIDVLRSWGCRILPSGEGRTACGDRGTGRLIEVEEVFDMISGTWT